MEVGCVDMYKKFISFLLSLHCWFDYPGQILINMSSIKPCTSPTLLYWEFNSEKPRTELNKTIKRIMPIVDQYGCHFVKIA